MKVLPPVLRHGRQSRVLSARDKIRLQAVEMKPLRTMAGNVRNILRNSEFREEMIIMSEENGRISTEEAGTRGKKTEKEPWEPGVQKSTNWWLGKRCRGEAEKILGKFKTPSSQHFSSGHLEHKSPWKSHPHCQAHDGLCGRKGKNK